MKGPGQICGSHEPGPFESSACQADEQTGMPAGASWLITLETRHSLGAKALGDGKSS